jgi:hypothetical protein
MSRRCSVCLHARISAINEPLRASNRAPIVRIAAEFGITETIADLVSGGQRSAASLDWPALSYAHTAALRTRLAELYAPATANRHLAALRGVLRECWRLGYPCADRYQRVADLPPVRGSRLRGRAFGEGEVRALFSDCAEDRSPAQGNRERLAHLPEGTRSDHRLAHGPRVRSWAAVLARPPLGTPGTAASLIGAGRPGDRPPPGVERQRQQLFAP